MVGPRKQDTLLPCTPFTSDALDGSNQAGSGFLGLIRDLDCGIRPENVAIFSMMFRSMMFRIPMPNPSPNLTDKVKATLLSQVSEIANQVCDGMLVAGAAVPLKNRDGLGGPGNVVGFIGHALSSDSATKRGRVVTVR
jgi:hypothetical protein